MTAEDYLRELNDLQERLDHVAGAAARKLGEFIAESRSACQQGSERALAPLFRQFQLVDLSHRVSRTECESPYIMASPRH